MERLLLLHNTIFENSLFYWYRIHIESNLYNVRFCCNLGSVYSREVILGETESDLPSDKLVMTFQDEFDTKQLSRIVKMSGLSPSLNIYCIPNLPMLIRSKIGNLGILSIFMKSRCQVEEETMQNTLLSSCIYKSIFGRPRRYRSSTISWLKYPCPWTNIFDSIAHNISRSASPESKWINDNIAFASSRYLYERSIHSSILVELVLFEKNGRPMAYRGEHVSYSSFDVNCSSDSGRFMISW